MTCPETRDELIDWFCTGRNVTHDREQLTRFVDFALARPDPFCSWDKDPIEPSTLWNRIVDRHFLYLGGKNGWIKRDGEYLTCSWAGHDHLLSMMGMTPGEAERSGWVRVSRGSMQTCFRISAAQRRKLKEIGIDIDPLERTLPRWAEKN